MKGKQLNYSKIIGIIVAIIIIAGLFLYASTLSSEFRFTSPFSLLGQNEKVSILIVGDIMLDRNVRNIINKNGFDSFFGGVKNLISDVDIAVANLEGPFTINRLLTSSLKNKTLTFTFDPSLAPQLAELGFDVLGLANNHTLNFGKDGLASTRKYIKETDMLYYGEPNNKDETSTIRNLAGLISSLNNPDILKQSVRWISDDRGGLLANIFHNRRIEYVREIVKGYLAHFDPAFFFLDRAQSKYRAPGMGLLYLWELPFMIVGLYDLARRGKRWSAVLFLWVILAPVAASPTLWLPHPVRTIVFLPALQVITAFGVTCAIGWLLRRRLRVRYTGFGLIGMVIFTSFLYYFHQYYIHIPIDGASDWQYGRQQVVEEVKKRESAYDRVVVSTTLDQPQIFFLYYLKYDPARYLSEGGTISGKFDTQENHFAKYYFRSVAGDTSYVNQKTLYVSTPAEMPTQATQLADIQYPDGTIAFVLYEK